jgi:hypothetical protein
MNTIKKISTCAIVMCACFLAGRFLSPKETEIKEVEKIVYRETTSKNEDKKTRSVRRVIVLPDGTKSTEITRETEKKTQETSKVEAKKEKVSEIKTKAQSDWSIGVYGNSNEFVSTIDRRILGGIFIGAYGRSNRDLNDRQYGFGVRFEF